MKIQKNNYMKVTSDLISIAKLASSEIMKIYKSNFKFANKEDNSPVTEADKISNKIKSDYNLSLVSEKFCIINNSRSHKHKVC